MDKHAFLEGYLNKTAVDKYTRYGGIENPNALQDYKNRRRPVQLPNQSAPGTPRAPINVKVPPPNPKIKKPTHNPANDL